MSQPAPTLSGEIRELLVELADTLVRVRPGAEMSEAIRLARPLVLAERLHGPGEKAFATETQLIAALPHVRDGQTRDEYAAQLRLIAQGVTQ
ncbi:hypothetical protein ACH4Q7_14740 [Streptomyces roseolus]|uniref:hypothetical protein n=1 Tax=Streptomyces roseolus TaxID=67358 RepID=UPI003797A7C6